MTDSLNTIIDRAIKQDHESSNTRRGHLGASVAGAKCPRQIWYGFRWFHQTKHTGRILRLFDRGHKEEARVVEWLRLGGITVRDFSERLCWYDGEYDGKPGYLCQPWEEEEGQPFIYDVSEDRHHIALATVEGVGPKQWAFKDHNGHFAGSCDGMVYGDVLCKLYGVEGWGLLECKTHSQKSFDLLKRSWVISSKPLHYIQMQLYMKYFGLKWALYVAVNKNDDDIHYEVVRYAEEVAEMYSVRAGKIIETQRLPNRVTDDPSWFECKFCDFREHCFYQKPAEVNCRSCAYATPDVDGQWRCNKYNAIIPNHVIPEGCAAWEQIE